MEFIGGGKSTSKTDVKNLQLTQGAEDQSSVTSIDISGKQSAVLSPHSAYLAGSKNTLNQVYNVQSVDKDVLASGFHAIEKGWDDMQVSYSDLLGLTGETAKINAALAESSMKSVIDYAGNVNEDVIGFAGEGLDLIFDYTNSQTTRAFDLMDEYGKNISDFASGAVGSVKEAYAMATEKDVQLKNNQVTFILGGVVLLAVVGVMAFSRRSK